VFKDVGADEDALMLECGFEEDPRAALTPALSRLREREKTLTPALSRKREREKTLTPTLSRKRERE